MYKVTSAWSLAKTLLHIYHMHIEGEVQGVEVQAWGKRGHAKVLPCEGMLKSD